MTDQPESSPTAKAAQRALELKRAAGRAPVASQKFQSEKSAAARSASKSKPALRK